MIAFLYILLGVFGALVFGSVLYLLLADAAQSRRARKKERLTGEYLRSLYQWAYQEHIDRPNFSRLVNGGSRTLEAELVARVSLLTYGHITSRMEKLVQWRHIDRMLLRRANETRGYARAKYIKVLSMLPVSDRTARRVRLFENDRNRYVRLFALLTQINHTPDRLIDIIAGYCHRMGNLEFSQIALLIRRRFIPVSIYRELIGSYDRNQVMLGLYIVRLFRIDDAATAVAHIIPTPDKLLRNTVLQTLVAIRSPLTQRRVVTTVSLMGERGRKRFYRLAASEGYSLNALRPLISMEHSHHLGGYLCNAVNGRKRKLHSLHQESQPL